MSTTADRTRHGFVRVAGVRLHYVEIGSGPAVLLLHGFPESWLTWRHQLPSLAERYRVIALDLPGYGQSEALGHRSRYRLPAVTEVVLQASQALGVTRMSVVGHDWGGLIGWCLALNHPEVVQRLVVLNSPHPSQVRAIGLHRPAQLIRSSYLLFFQAPAIPELVLRVTYPAVVRCIVRDANARAAYRAAPGRWDARAMLNYYRELFTLRRLDWQPVRVPILVLWSERDLFLERRLADEMASRWAAPRPGAPGARVEILPGAGHWVHHQRPDLVNPHIAGFLAAV